MKSGSFANATRARTTDLAAQARPRPFLLYEFDEEELPAKVHAWGIEYRDERGTTRAFACATSGTTSGHFTSAEDALFVFGFGHDLDLAYLDQLTG
ncbi:hypothetical protein [Amycolatopsis antarctica]|nr:hypothetical protein [Amycolatopsis antarctica]